MCRCRHGGRGNTCSKYCADRYKKIFWHWKLNNPKNTKENLDEILSKFNLSLINKDVLRPLFGAETMFIQKRCKDISIAMFKIQDRRKLKSDGSKLLLEQNLLIDKDTFYLYQGTYSIGKIEDQGKK